MGDRFDFLIFVVKNGDVGSFKREDERVEEYELEVLGVDETIVW